MPVAPFIPSIVSAVGGGLAARRAQSSAMRRSPEELAALESARTSGMALQGTAGDLRTLGSSLTGQGVPALQQAGSYWSRLLGGNRAQMAQATAGPRAALTDIYRGAERGLAGSTVRGAARDVAQGELIRSRASQIAGLTTGVQPAAAQALQGVGSEFLGKGLGAQEA